MRVIWNSIISESTPPFLPFYLYFPSQQTEEQVTEQATAFTRKSFLAGSRLHISGFDLLDLEPYLIVYEISWLFVYD